MRAPYVDEGVTVFHDLALRAPRRPKTLSSPLPLPPQPPPLVLGLVNLMPLTPFVESTCYSDGTRRSAMVCRAVQVEKKRPDGPLQRGGTKEAGPHTGSHVQLNHQHVVAMCHNAISHLGTGATRFTQVIHTGGPRAHVMPPLGTANLLKLSRHVVS